MSNQANGFKVSQPFITDKQFQNLSLNEIRHIIKEEREELKKDYKELGERRKLIKKYNKLKEAREKVKKGIDIKKERKKKVKKPPKKKKIKSFEEYFEECIKNKEIPSDTPSYLREALERAIKEYNKGLIKEKSSLENFANKNVIKGEPGLIPVDFLNKIHSTLEEFFTYHRNIKFNMLLVCLMEQQLLSKDKGVIGLNQSKAYFTSGIRKNLKSTDVNELINLCSKNILKDIDAYQENGSGWYFIEVVQLEIHTVEFNPSKGSSYIPLPDWISNKKAIVNIQNKDEKCFLWCILRYLHPKENHEETLKDLKEYENSLNTKGISFPMKLKDITKFEKLNPELPGINVFSADNYIFYPLRMAERDCLNTIDLFLYEEGGVSHYTLIKNFHRLIKSQKTKSKNGSIFICKRCFTHYTKEELLQKHILYCSNNETVSVKMPEEGTMLYFKNYDNQLPIPFVVYADFECFTKPINTCIPNPKESYSYNYQKHEPSGFCFYIKGIDPNISFKPIIYTKTNDSDNVAEIFVNKLTEVTNSIYNDFYRRPKPLRLNKEEQKSFDKAEICHICSKELKKEKVRDHCHFTGKYRGAAHNKCNLMCKKPRILPVIFHNFQGYDAHLFIKQLACLPGELNCIPSTEEKYISFSKKIKVVYPYDYVSSLEKLSETQLPPKEEFYSKLNDEDISDDDYQHAINVWNTFECKTIRDYHDLYLKTDVLLLADVFENFRKTCLKHYTLDPAHYYTSPGLAWDACLKETGQKLQLLHDYDKLMMFERGIRGGISHISKRYAEANNKYMKDYNPDKESTYIQYLDANNLYGWAMSQQLPIHGFSWKRNLTKEKVMDILDKANHSMSNRGRKGYIFEVDLEYPKKLWKSHNGYPLEPEKMIVNGVEKLICHFKPRKNYVVHYRNLRQYLEMGMRLTAVHRGISFYQSSWMEPYIRKNTELRKTAANSFEKDFFKLMNNSVFGKTIENIRKRQNIILIDDRKKAVKLTSRPNFDRATIFDRNLIAVHMKKTEVYFNKPVYVEKFDTSDYPPDHESGILTGVNKKVIGMFKDEVAGRQITKFVGLRPKLYTFKIEDGSLTKKCKGVKKNVVKKGIEFENYVECLFTGEKQMRTMKIIRSENHDIYSKEVNKIALSSEDDKRKVLKDRVHTLSFR
ncbi:unnamed protein product [Porites evermanni]|uniref:DNA-directed DNA polymerase n=1 Tax=Porites evermanni TaxID=104178 RepID=A0ABN8MDD2_9CNID|nr:unnamed protein product [Porites evermanni]